MSDIVASFEGPFKEQRTPHSSWLPVRGADVPDPHPAKVYIAAVLLVLEREIGEG